MRVLQLIDSLQTGGAEKVTVNMANALSKEIEYISLCATRAEGPLKQNIQNKVDYLFLNKKHSLDVKSIKRLSSFIKEKKIQILHAHSTSFFLATLVKLLNHKLKIVWHDHYGNSDFLYKRKYAVLKKCSNYFSHVFSVNKNLEIWAKQKLNSKQVSYLPNFATLNKGLVETNLNGVSGKRIICLANLRPQKDHIGLIEAFKQIQNQYPEWTLHCVGKHFQDDYSSIIQYNIRALNLEDSIFLYDSRPDIYNILNQCEIGVLASKSEGMPLALLEYGLANLAVVATKVGECETVIANQVNGLLVNPSSPQELAKAIILYIENENMRHTFAKRYKKHVDQNYSESAQIETILNTYKSILNN